MLNYKDSFLKTVEEQIRWKRARKPLLSELETHILDIRDGLIENGADSDTAEKRAVEEMGDPEMIGLELDRVHRPRPNWMLICCVILLLFTGLWMMWTVGDREEYFNKMLIFSVIGTFALIGGYFLDYTALAKCPIYVLFVLCIIGPVLTVLMSDDILINSMCYVLPLFFAVFVYRLRNKKNSAIIISVAFAACLLVCVFSLQWASLTIYIYIVNSGIILYAAINRWLDKERIWIIWSTLAVTLLCAVLMYGNLLPDTFNCRMEGVIDPNDAPESWGWVPLNLRDMIESSKFIGEGSTSDSLGRFLEARDLGSVDYMLAFASHKFGIIVFVFVVAVITLLISATLCGIRRQSCKFGAVILLTIGLCFVLRTIFYIIGNLGFGLFAFEGIPLFSYTGMTVIVDMFIVGILLSVSRTESVARDIKDTNKKSIVR